MDQYSSAELSELYLMAQSVIDTQFQYWITITFAVVVASFVAGARLTQKLRVIVTTLYVTATIVLFYRIFWTGDASFAILAELGERGATIFEVSGNTPVLGRTLVILLGTGTAVYFVLSAKRAHGGVRRE